MEGREEKGLICNIVKELRMEDSRGFKEMLRLDHECFLDILQWTEKDITPQELLKGVIQNNQTNGKAYL